MASKGLSRTARVASLTAFASGTTYAGLSTVNPGDDGQSRVEPAFGTGGYARVAVSWSAVSAPGALDAAVELVNSALITFGASGTAYSTGATQLAWLTLWNHATNTAEANFLGRFPLNTPNAISADGASIAIAAGQLKVTLTPQTV